MFANSAPPVAALDVPTLSFVAVCIAALLGLLLTVAWMQQRDVRALAWWGAAYLIGASAMALWCAPAEMFRVPPAVSSALIFIACGMIWNGVRLFQGRRLLPFAVFAGAVVWLLLSPFPAFAHNGSARVALSAVVVACYTFAIAFELGRERRKMHYSAIRLIVVPGLHAGIFLLPLVLHAFVPGVLDRGWLTVFTLETLIYAVGAAFIVLMMVQDHQVQVYRSAAETDFLTRLLNRRTFLEEAQALCARQAARREPVSLLMFDLDHFKSINDRFGHALGDSALQVFRRSRPHQHARDRYRRPPRRRRVRGHRAGAAGDRGQDRRARARQLRARRCRHRWPAGRRHGQYRRGVGAGAGRQCR